MSNRTLAVGAWVVLGAVVALAVLWRMAGAPGAAAGSGPAQANKVVLYCATDREIVQELIDEFQAETGIQVDAKFDTEAAKAVGLVQEIRQEKGNPQCDVLLGGGPFFATMLANDGCLAAAPADLVRAEGSAPHDPQGRWLGFAGVYRILIVNTDALPKDQRPHSYRDLTDARYKGHVGIANPLFGGMAAHTAAIFSKVGEEEGRKWLEGLRENDVAICAGMADVKNRVASGELWCGITSTIDAHVALVAGKPVEVIFPDQGPGEIGCLNGFNSVAMIKGGPHPAEAERLVRFLLTMRTEKILSAGPGQNFGLLPASVAADVRPAWIPRGIREIELNWDDVVKIHPAANKAVKEILLSP